MMKSVLSLLDRVELPRMVEIKQIFERDGLTDCAGELQRGLDQANISELVKPGMTIAITAGSRGVSNTACIISALGEYLKAKGAKPFVIPAMGSHGGATAEGQAKVLEMYGITEKEVGLPIKSSMEVAKTGELKDGTPVYVDRFAYEADGIIALNRVKLHTGYRAKYESGVMKMLAVGLGKQAGADLYHRKGLDQIPVYVEQAANHIIDRMNIIAGVALLENAFDETFAIKVARKNDISIMEPAWLELSKSKMASIRFNDLDVLIVDKIGKNYSGGGMDSNITRRFINPNIHVEPLTKIIAILDLAKETEGNANGIGVADVVTQRLVDKIDFEAGYMNSLTSGVTISNKIPITMPSDLYAIKAAMKLAKQTDAKAVRMVRIPNTMELGKIQISESLLQEIKVTAGIEIAGELKPMDFHSKGNLF